VIIDYKKSSRKILNADIYKKAIVQYSDNEDIIGKIFLRLLLFRNNKTRVCKIIVLQL